MAVLPSDQAQDVIMPTSQGHGFFDRIVSTRRRQDSGQPGSLIGGQVL